MEYVPPWREPYFIGVAGCSGSGKTTITRELTQKLNVPWTVLLSMDNFYRPLGWDDRQLAFKSEYDFDHPNCVDFDMLYDVLKKLKRGEKAEIPIYSFKEHNRTSQSLTLYGANIVIVEGIYALYDPRVLEMLDLKVFVHEDYDVCMARRLSRDTLHRGRDLELSIKQWHKFVKPNYLSHILPTAKSANLLVPKGIENLVAINMLYSFLQRQLQQKSEQHLLELRKLGEQSAELTGDDSPWFSTLEQTNQVKVLLTMMQNVHCDRESFIFAVDRVARRMMSEALDLICTNLNVDIGDLRLSAVTQVRGGECFEAALRAMMPELYIGRLLILSDSRTGEPKLHLCKLPDWIGSEPKIAPVILTTAQVSSGASAVMALAILIDHGVKQEHIVFCAFVSSEIGARRIRAAFPRVHLLFGERQASMRQLDIDTRYYGT